MTRRVQQTAWLVLGIGLAVCASRAWSHRQEIVATRAQAREIGSLADGVRHDVLTLRNVMQEATVVGRAADWSASIERPLAAVQERLRSWRDREAHAAAKVHIDSALEELEALQQNAVQAHDFLDNGQRSLANEVVLADGAQLSNALYARLSEAQRVSVEALERSTAQLSSSEASLIVGLIVLGAIGFVALGPVVFRKDEPDTFGAIAEPADHAMAAPSSSDHALGEVEAAMGPAPSEASPQPARHEARADEPASSGPATPAPPLGELARLCTEFARVKDRQELESLLDNAMRLLDARGLIVWHPVNGRVLHPVLARGYGSKTLARMPDLPLSDTGSITGAYRAGDLRVITGRNGDSGALVLPILSAEGCLGVVTLELHGGESSEATQAMGRILVAQLATIVAPDSSAGGTSADSRAAATTSAG